MDTPRKANGDKQTGRDEQTGDRHAAWEGESALEIGVGHAA